MRKGLARTLVIAGAIVAMLAAWFVPAGAAPIAYSPTPIAGWSTNGIVKAVTIIGDTAYAGGSFTQVQGPGGSPTLARSNLAAFDIHTGAIRAAFTGGTNGRIESMTNDGTHLFIGGDFTTVNNLNKVRLASLDPVTGAVNNGFTAGATSHVYALRVKGNRLYVGGSFSTLGNVARGRIAAVDPNTGAVDPSFNPNADDAVHAIVTSPDGNTVYAGGDFLNIGGGARGWLAPLSASTGQLLPLVFQYPVVTGSIPGVWDLDISPAGDRLFGALGGYENRVSSWSTTSGQNQWFYQVDGDTQAVKYVNGNVYFGFHDGALDDHTIRMRAADAATGTIDNFYTPMDSFFGVWDIDANADALVVGGEFTNFSGVATQGIAILPKASSDTVPPGPPSNLTVTGSAATTVSLSWSPGTDNQAVAGYRILRNGVEVAYPTGTTYTDSDLTPQTSYTYTVQTVDAAGNFSTSSNVAVGTTGVVLLPAGSVWKYLDNGSNQGTAWRAPAFNDSTWASGPAQLGYGDGDEATVVGFGPDPNHKYATTYFRRQFTVANPATVGGLTLRLLRDDGAVVYLNGTEVVRSNMPAGTITSTTNAVNNIEGADEIAWNVFSVNPALLTAGTNTLAVEIHQQWGGSSDISFDLALETAGVNGAPPVVTLQSPANNSFVTTPSTTFSGGCTNGAGTVSVNVTGTATATLGAPCTSGQWTVTAPLGDGSYSASASQTLGGLTGTSAGASFVVDTTPPVVTLVQPADGASVFTLTPAFSGACSTGDGNVSVTVTGTASASLSAPCVAGAWSTTGSLTSGNYTATARQTDQAGNTGTSSANVFTVSASDTTPPVTTDNTASIGSAWHNGPVTVTLTATDPSGVAATYFTTDGSTPTTASQQGASIPLTVNGTYTIKYFSVDTLGNVEPVETAGTQIRIDTSAPSTTDDTAPLGSAWTASPRTVTLTPTDTGGSGVAATYYTTDGSTPTTGSAQGTSIPLTADGVYTVKYFSVDAAGNTEPVRTAGTQIRIDATAPILGVTFPTNGTTFTAAGWNTGCAVAGICGSDGDALSGVDAVNVTIQRQSDGAYWTGSAWQAGLTTITPAAGVTWSVPLPTSALSNAATYVVTAQATDLAGNSSAVVTRTFTYNTPPTNLHTTSVTGSSVALAWDAPSELNAITSYNIYRNGALVGSSPTTTFTDTTVTGATSYGYTVTAVDAAQVESVPSPMLTVATPDGVPPSQPTGLAAPTVASDHVVLTWTASTDNVAVTGYDVLRNNVVIGSAPTATYTDNTVAPATTYSYTVRARDAAGNLSLVSTALPVTTPAFVGKSYEDTFDSGSFATAKWTTLNASMVAGNTPFFARLTAGGGNAASLNWPTTVIEQNHRSWTYRGYFRVESHNANQVVSLVELKNSASKAAYLYTNPTNGRCIASLASITATTSFSCTDNAWHLVEMKGDFGATTWTLDWKIDGVAQPSISATGQSVATVRSLWLGETGGGPTDVTDWDNVKLAVADVAEPFLGPATPFG